MYVRYFPVSYKKVRIQVYMPEDVLDADNKLNNEYVVFDPTGQQAIPAFTNAQRLGIGAPVIAVIREIIKVNKQTTPQRKYRRREKEPENEEFDCLLPGTLRIGLCRGWWSHSTNNPELY
ncbi:MAG: hypothetical protein IPN39_13415 [Chitinophagaceae bacterium]|nr:hypothetical protein [Chitinophagaceae bacterium]